MPDVDIPFGWTSRIEYEAALMRSPLAAQLLIVHSRIRSMMREQGALHPRDLVATSALASDHRSMLPG